MAICKEISGLRITLQTGENIEDLEDLAEVEYENPPTSSIKAPQVVRHVRVGPNTAIRTFINIDEEYEHKEYHFCGWIYLNGRRWQHMQTFLGEHRPLPTSNLTTRAYRAEPTSSIPLDAPCMFC